MLTKKQAWLRVAEMATEEAVDVDIVDFFGLCEHLDEIASRNELSDPLMDSMITVHGQP